MEKRRSTKTHCVMSSRKKLRPTSRAMGMPVDTARCVASYKLRNGGNVLSAKPPRTRRSSLPVTKGR
jgi:hypothetical protein